MPRSDPPRTTEQAQIPGAFEGETITRRRLITGTAQAAGAIALAAFTLPALGFAVAPVFHRAAAHWQDIGPLASFSDSDYVPVVMSIANGVGEAGSSIAYVRRHNAEVDGPVKDRYDEVVAISNRCARWVPRSLRARRSELRVSLPRRRLQLSRHPSGWSPTPSPRPLLHADP
jgi:hypothetical protein